MKSLAVVVGLYLRYHTVWSGTDVAKRGGLALDPPPGGKEVHAQVSHPQRFLSRRVIFHSYLGKKRSFPDIQTSLPSDVIFPRACPVTSSTRIPPLPRSL